MTTSCFTATENDGINCDNPESVGKNIHAGLDNVYVENAKVRWKDKIKTFEYLRPGVKIDSKHFHNDSRTLFTRLTAILQRETDSAENFN